MSCSAWANVRGRLKQQPLTSKNMRQIAQHTDKAGHQANSLPTPRHTERWAPPKLNAHTTNTKLDARRTPRRHTDTAERWASPKARRGHDTVLGPAPADSPPAHRPSGAAGLPAPLTPHYKEQVAPARTALALFSASTSLARAVFRATKF